MKKTKFEEPVLELIRLQNSDILCLSTETQNGEGNQNPADNEGPFSNGG